MAKKINRPSRLAKNNIDGTKIDNEYFVIDFLNIEKVERKGPLDVYCMWNKINKGRNKYWISAWDNLKHL